MPRVLIVDDSPVARKVLAEILGADPDLEIAGFAENGLEAVSQAIKLKPDVITMDLNMPVMDGFEATREIMIEAPTPIVVVSATRRAAEVETAMEALQAGALNLLLKPVGPASAEFRARAKEVVNTVKAMAEVFVIRRRRSLTPVDQPLQPEIPRPIAMTSERRFGVVAVATSTGGPPALTKVFSDVRQDFPIPILLVQHIAPGFMDGFVKWLDGVISLRVKAAKNHEVLRPATVYVAPQDRHLGVTRKRIVLSDAPPIGGFRPAATHMFEKAAEAFGPESVGVILTGMGEDGVQGLKRIHDAGGVIVAQDEATSAVFGMPRVAIESDIVDVVLPIQEIGNHLQELVKQRAPK